MSSEIKIFCSRCGSSNTNTLKAKQTDGSMSNMVVKSEPTFMWNVDTGETGIGNEDTTYILNCICVVIAIDSLLW